MYSHALIGGKYRAKKLKRPGIQSYSANAEHVGGTVIAFYLGETTTFH